MQISSTDWVSIASAAAAWVAAWLAFRSARTARQTYNLAREQERRFHPSLELYLVDAHIRRLESPLPRLYVFRIMVTNKSDAANSLKDLKLVVGHKREQGPLSNVAIPHNPGLAAYLPENHVELVNIPCGIAARTVLGGLAIFGVPQDLLRDSKVESYTLTVVDSFGHETTLEAILLREVNDVRMEKNSD